MSRRPGTVLRRLGPKRSARNGSPSASMTAARRSTPEPGAPHRNGDPGRADSGAAPSSGHSSRGAAEWRQRQRAGAPVRAACGVQVADRLGIASRLVVAERRASRSRKRRSWRIACRQQPGFQLTRRAARRILRASAPVNTCSRARRVAGIAAPAMRAAVASAAGLVAGRLLLRQLHFQRQHRLRHGLDPALAATRSAAPASGLEHQARQPQIGRVGRGGQGGIERCRVPLRTSPAARHAATSACRVGRSLGMAASALRSSGSACSACPAASTQLAGGALHGAVTRSPGRPAAAPVHRRLRRDGPGG